MREHRRVGRGQRVELPRSDVHHARRFGGVIAAPERRAEDDRHFPEELPRRTHTDHPFDAVDGLGCVFQAIADGVSG